MDTKICVCGEVYEIYKVKHIMRDDADSVSCEKCKAVLVEWGSGAASFGATLLPGGVAALRQREKEADEKAAAEKKKREEKCPKCRKLRFGPPGLFTCSCQASTASASEPKKNSKKKKPKT